MKRAPSEPVLFVELCFVAANVESSTADLNLPRKCLSSHPRAKVGTPMIHLVHKMLARWMREAAFWLSLTISPHSYAIVHVQGQRLKEKVLHLFHRSSSHETRQHIDMRLLTNAQHRLTY